MQVCCKSAGSSYSVWLGQAHLYSKVCRSSFWEMGVFLAWGIDVSTAIFEMHSKWAGIRDGVRRVSHSTLGSWAIVGNPWVARVMDWVNREIMETQHIHIFTSLITLIALQVLTSVPSWRPTLQLISLLHHWQVDIGAQAREGLDDGQWEVELIGKRDYRLCEHPDTKEKIFPDCSICQNNWGGKEVNRKEHWIRS